MSPAPRPLRCSRCGRSLDAAAAAGDKPFCPWCGASRTAFDAGPDAEGPTDLTLGPLILAAGAGWRANVGRLTVSVIVTGLTWLAVAVAVGFAFGSCLVMEQAAVVLVPVWFAGVWATACILLHGLAGTHLGAVRGWTAVRRTFDVPHAGRAALCGVPVIFLQVVLKWVPPLAGAGAFGTPGGDVPALIGFGVGQCVPAATFALLWPTAFLIHDRPDLNGLRPLAEAVRLPAGRRSGAVAVGLLAYALLAGPLLAYDLLYLGLFEIVAPQTWMLGPDRFRAAVFGTVGLSVLVPLLAGPPAGLLLAHAYDRLARGAVRGEDEPVSVAAA